MAKKDCLNKDFLKQIFSLKNILDYSVMFFTAFSFLSIPIFSFRTQYYKFTWMIVIALVIFMLISIVLLYKFKFDFVSLSLLLFSFSSIISSALSGFKAFKITAPALSILSLIIYTYCKANSGCSKKLLVAVYIADVVFLSFFIFHYRNELFSLSFKRIGDYYGDINDVSLFMALGFCFSIYCVLFNKKIVIKILTLFLSLAFLFCGITTGSKIFILLVLLSVISFVFSFFGKKKWWLSIIVIVALIGLGYFVIQLPFLATLKSRIDDFLFTIIGKSSSSSAKVDLSTIDRMHMFFAGMEMFLRKPVFGWGIWGFATFGGINNGWSHNNISESFCNFGLLGTLFFHFGMFVSIKSFIFSKTKKEMTLAFILLIYFMIAMLSVALYSEKIYMFISPIIFNMIYKTKKECHFEFINIKRFFLHENR